MGKKKLPKAPSKQINIEIVYVTSQEGENNERIQRLSRNILRIVANAGKKRGVHSRKVADKQSETNEELFGPGFEKSIGL